MNSTNRKSPEAKGLSQQSKQTAGHANQFKPAVAQLKNAVSAQSIKRPLAPPVYRPQPTSPVAQAKAVGQSLMRVSSVLPANDPFKQPKVLQPKRVGKGQTIPPPAYRPQPVPRVLQTKIVATHWPAC